MGVISVLRGLRGWALSVTAVAAVLAAAGPVAAQLSAVSNSTVGAGCSGGGSGDGDCRNSVSFPALNNGTTFQSRYAWNINADIGVFSTHDTSGTPRHNVSFTATAPGGYRVDLATQRSGDMNRVNDLAGCDGAADTVGVTGSSNITLNSGSLSLGDPGSIGNGGSTTDTPFNQTTSGTIFRVSNGVGQGHVLTFTWSGSVRSNSCEAAVRQGESSGTTSGCSACGYPGSPGRTQSTDGHFLTVTFTSLCGNGTVDVSVSEQCDEGASNGASTSCCTSACQFRSSGSSCRPAAGSCDVAETCSGSAGDCPADSFAPNTTICRGAAGECDLQELCPGNSSACPADAKKANGTACTADSNPCTLDQCNGSSDLCQHPAGNAGAVCRAAAGVCDVQETCTGASTTCPGNGFAASTLQCRASAGVCDVAENCTGSGANCPVDGFASTATVCRPAAGECDLADNCPGTGISCTADAKKSNGTACTDDGNVCTNDVCNGTSDTCTHPNNSAPCSDGVYCNGTDTCSGGSCSVHAGDPCTGGGDCNTQCNEGPQTCFNLAGASCTDDGNPCSSDICDGAGACTHPAGNGGASCRPAAGVCDNPEFCDGASTSCPADSVSGAFVQCRSSAGECDPAENCDGVGVNCPADAKTPSGTPCTSDGNVCTVDECDGANDACQHPAGNGGTVCRAAAGVCDIAELCDGASPSCPADAVEASSVECRASAGVCDLAENCDGVGVACPADAKSTAECRGSAGQCDVAENCNGVSDGCPADAVQPNGTPCIDGNACTADTCQAGTCVGVQNFGVCLDDFLCYKDKITPGLPKFVPILNLPLQDSLETKVYDVKKPKHLCLPADRVTLTNPGVVDPTTHLHSFQIKLAIGQTLHVKQLNIGVANDIGTLRLDTVKAELLLVPTNKDLLTPPVEPLPANHNVDTFKCYKVKVTKGTPKFPRGVQAQSTDQFTSPVKRYDVKRPKYLCKPAVKDGEPIKVASRHLLCYVVKPALGEPLHVPKRAFVNVLDIAGTDPITRVDTIKEDLMCVPSELVP